MEIAFWICALLIGYVYLGYPALAGLAARIAGKRVKKSNAEPSITILIAAYNEEKELGKTIENKLSLDYPAEKFQVIVVSDGSSDRTDEIVRSFEQQGVTLIRQEPRAGKTSALNLAVPQAHGEILVFSDANSIYAKNALRVLVSNFADPGVGYVTGKMIYTSTDGAPIGDGCSAYMKYENLLRKWETLAGSVVGVDGGIDAVRKSLYRPMRPDQLPDFVLPLKVVEQGFRVVYEEGAELKEQPLAKAHDEYRMRVRVSLRALWALWDMKFLLNLWSYGFFSVALFSHKVIRYGAFMFLLGLYAANALLLSSHTFYLCSFILQTAFYALALMAWLVERSAVNLPLPFVPYYFSLLNLAAAHAFLKFLKGEKAVIWKPRLG